MIIEIDASSTAKLVDAENFKAFKVTCSCSREMCADGLTTIGIPDGEHVWVDRDWLSQNGPQRDDWQAGLAKMIAFAANSGWVNETGFIRAHIEGLNRPGIAVGKLD